MKISSNNITSIALISMIVPFSSFLLDNQESIDRNQFIGVWVNEEDSSNRWIFTQYRLTIKDTGFEDVIYTFNISKRGSQCGIPVPTSRGESYLEISRVDAPENKTCFLVNGFAEVKQGEKTLSISQVTRGGATLLVKQ